MPQKPPIRGLGIGLVFLLCLVGLFGTTSAARGEDVFIGSSFPYYANVSPAKTQTFISVFGATTGGFVTHATFGWSATNCPGAVKIKFFRPLGGGYVNFVAERGPFSVTNALQPAGTVPPVTQTVTLDPPVSVREGDWIGITNVTSCGGPTWSVATIPLPTIPPPSWTLVYDGDVTYGVGPIGAVGSSYAVFVNASGPTKGLGFLGDRFEVNLTATDPRTGATTAGTARSLSDVAGYFSLPDFTRDSTFPEVTVKMVDATAAPPPFGGAFWFFHSSLTDVTYTLTVTDHRSGRVRTYTSAGSPAFCGGADTNAFPP